jgi:hypothetical protein
MTLNITAVMSTRSPVVSSPILLKPNFVGVLTETPSANVKTVLADESLMGLAHPTMTCSFTVFLRMTVPNISVPHG